MTKDIEELKRDYRAVSAPPHVATRIRAGVSESRVRHYRWKPAAVALTAVIALFWLMPGTDEPSPAPQDKPLRPSLSALAALKPARPVTPLPSLSQIRSVSVPRMPTKPVMPPADETTYEFDNKVLKEKNDAHI